MKAQIKLLMTTGNKMPVVVIRSYQVAAKCHPACQHVWSYHRALCSQLGHYSVLGANPLPHPCKLP